jgi:hypothetical protein
MNRNTFGAQDRSGVQKLNQGSAIRRDTSKSDRILERFRQSSFKSRRKRIAFSGTWETTVEELFPLLCPTREADWIPGWDCELIYAESGYAEDNCVFRTDKSNAVGDGLWMFVGFQVNDYVEFVKVQEDIVTRARITVSDNGDGTVTGTWNVLCTGLTEKGNREVDKMSEEDPHSSALVKMIEHYLKEGKTIKPAALAMGMVADRVQAHFS